MSLARARCVNHELRQASGICPTCRRSFCKECLTEHDGRLTCASCLRRAAPEAKASRGFGPRLQTPAMLLGAVLASWFFFYSLGTYFEMSTAPEAPRKAAPRKAAPRKAAPPKEEPRKATAQ